MIPTFWRIVLVLGIALATFILPLAADVRITSVQIDQADRVVISARGDARAGQQLFTGNTVTNITIALQSSTGAADGTVRFIVPITEAAAFFRIQQTSADQVPLTTIVATSPFDGESGISVNRETVVRFSAPLADDSVLSSNQFYATFGGRRILSRSNLSADRLYATLFYLEPLPGGARVSVFFDGEGIKDYLGRPIDPNGHGAAGGVRRIQFNTHGTAPVPGTAVIGRVLAAELSPTQSGTAEPAERPLENVIITVDGREEELRAVTDASGNFKLEPVPPGHFFVHIDGRTAKGSSWPTGSYYPVVGKAWTAVAGRPDNLAGGTGLIYLPLITEGTLQPVSATDDKTIGLPAVVLSNNPALAGVAITVPANSLHNEAGTRNGMIGLAPVPPDRLPSPLPPGVDPPIVITVQSDGPLNFDRPAPISFPNLEKLPPGEQTLIFSFNHDSGEWEVVGTATVSADGLTIRSDPGMGIRAPGWHFTSSATSTTTCGPGAADGSARSASGAARRSLALRPQAGEADVTFEGFNSRLFGDDGFEFTFAITYSPQDQPPNDGSCGARTEPREEGDLLVELEVDGPAGVFLQGLEDATYLLPKGGRMEVPVAGANLKEFARLLDADHLIAVNITARGFRDDGSEVFENSFAVGRWLTVVDPDGAPFSAKFLKTLADGRGGFVRGKSVRYLLPALVDTTVTASGAATGDFALGESLRTSGTTRWTFDPAAPGTISGSAQVQIGGKPLAGAIHMAGSAVAPVTLSPGRPEYEAKLKDYLQDTVNFLGANTPFTREFDSVSPLNNPSPAAVDQAVTAAGARLVDEVRQDFERANSAANIFRVVDSGGAFNVSWVDELPQGSFGTAGIDIHRARAQAILPNTSLALAAREYGFAELVNPDPTGTLQFAFKTHVRTFAGATPFAIYVANTVSHELAHELGLLEAYASAAGGGARNVPPSDLMRAALATDPNLDFADVHLQILKAGMGTAPDQVGSLQGAIAVFRQNFNLPESAAGLRDPVAPGTERPILSVTQNGSDLFTGSVFEFGTVLADGPNGVEAVAPFVLSNVGIAPLKLEEVRIGSQAAGFALRSTGLNSTTLQIGQSVTVQVAFDPSQPGPASSTLTVASDSAFSPNFTLNIGGRGLSTKGELALRVERNVQVDLFTAVAQNNLGALRLSEPPRQISKFATVINHGGGPLTITSLSVPDGSEQFSVSGLPAAFGSANPLVLQPNESLSFHLTFDARHIGLQRASLQIESDDPLQPVVRQTVVGTGLPDAGTALRYGSDYAAVARPGAPALRVRTSQDGFFSAIILPNQPYRLFVYDPESGLIWRSIGVGSRSGERTNLGVPVFVPSTDPDSDGDGLPDDVEFAIGTSPKLVDTDVDGIDDFMELQLGLDPLDGVAPPAGILANVPLPGAARKVVVDNGLAYVATGSHGLAIVDVTNPRTPIVLGLLELPGEALEVAVDAESGMALVASGAGGLHFVDVLEPTQPALAGTISGDIGSVVVADSTVFAGTSGAILVFDAVTGEQLPSIPLEGRSTPSLAVAGRHLYADVRRGGTFSVFDISRRDQAVVTGNLLVGIFTFASFVPITADNEVVYFAAGGLTTVGVSDPAAPAILSGADSEFTANAVMPNGSGLGLVAGGTDGLTVFDLTDPTKTSLFLTRYDTPGNSLGIAVDSGLAVVADGSAGLQVVNYISFDADGPVPTVEISSSVPDADPDAPGVQIVEGTDVPIKLRMADDGQIEKVELLQDGELILTRVRPPFALSAMAPAVRSGIGSVTWQVRVTDNAGNSSTSTPLVFGLLNDNTPPSVMATRPPDGGTEEWLPSLTMTFDKAIDLAQLNRGAITLRHLGTDGKPGGDDDTAVSGLQFLGRDFGRSLFVVLPEELAPGTYQLVLPASSVLDRAGNPSATDFTLTASKSPTLLNRTVSGTITEPGQPEVIRFNAMAGTRVFYDALDADSDDIRVKLVDPKGVRIFEHDSHSDGTRPWRLTETGEYQLIFGENTGASGSFAFRLLDVDAQATLALGELIEGRLDPGLETDLYHFEGATGQRLFFDGISGVPANSARVSVFFPEGANTGVSSARVENDFEFTANRDGAYVIAIYRSGSGTPVAVDYSFRITAPPSATVPMSLDTTIHGVISQPGELLIHTFTGVEGQRLYFDALMSESPNIQAELFGPSGASRLELFNLRTDPSRPRTLTETGEYRLAIKSITSDVGAFAFRLLDVAEQPALTQGAQIEGALDPRTRTDLFHFAGVAGERLFFDALAGGSSIGWELFGPNNDRLGGLSMSGDFEATLLRDGTHVLRLSGSGTGAGLPYRFRVVKPQAETFPLFLGTPASGTLEAGEFDAYTFSATAGQRVYYDALETDSDVLEVNLISPGGRRTSVVGDSDTNGRPMTLTEDGVYRLTIGGRQDELADYAFRLLDLARQPELRVGQITTGTFNPRLQSALYRITGATGQKLRFTPLSGGSAVSWALYAPDNRAVGGVSLAREFEVTLSAAGLYLLVLETGDGMAPLEYSFQVTEL